MKEQKGKKKQIQDPSSGPDASNREQDDQMMDAEISEEDIRDLEHSGQDRSSDESQSADLLDNEDYEGTGLNEGPDEDDLFDTGEDLDISKETLFPDEDPDSEDN